MKAGRELDALIAEKVMGLNPHWLGDGIEVNILSIGESGIEVPRFSTDIAAAWEVVEKLEGDGWGHRHLVHSPGAEHPGVSWMFMKPGQGDQSMTTVEIVGEIPYIICLAALKAVE